VIDFNLDFPLLDDEEHASRCTLLKNVLIGLDLIGVHSIGEFLPFVLCELEKEEMFAYGLLNKL
jgi:hypothetical protein